VEDITRGDTVSRISHANDVLFEVVRVVAREDGDTTCVLKGLDTRLVADAPLSDLKKVYSDELELCKKKVCHEAEDRVRKACLCHVDEEHKLRMRNRISEKEYVKIPGKVLHVDGDESYLEDCVSYYRKLGITAIGMHVPEERQPLAISQLLNQYAPDILVLTGHDGYAKNRNDIHSLDSYRTSKHFAKAIRMARRYEPDKDSLVIFAGACQSNYEALIEAGANFASSPKRVLINIFDPVFIVDRIANAHIDDIVNIRDVLSSTITGTDGIGGIETRGKMRLSLPRLA
jgi:spore coat assembly protein